MIKTTQRRNNTIYMRIVRYSIFLNNNENMEGVRRSTEFKIILYFIKMQIPYISLNWKMMYS